jgi:hypothetical protein
MRLTTLGIIEKWLWLRDSKSWEMNKLIKGLVAPFSFEVLVFNMFGLSMIYKKSIITV